MDDASDSFEETFRRHEFSELVKLALVGTNALLWLVGRRSDISSPRLQTLIPAEDDGDPDPRPDRSLVAPTARPALQHRMPDLAVAVAATLAMALLGAGHADAGNQQQWWGEPEIPVVLHVVSCATDLLECRDIQPPDSTFHGMEACHIYWAEAGRISSRAAGRIVFARCRYSPMATRSAPVLRNAVRRQIP